MKLTAEETKSVNVYSWFSWDDWDSLDEIFECCLEHVNSQSPGSKPKVRKSMAIKVLKLYVSDAGWPGISSTYHELYG